MNEQAGVFWEAAKKEVELLLPKSDFDLWVSRISYQDFDVENKVFTLVAPSTFVKSSCVNFISTFEIALSNVYGESVSVQLDVVKSQQATPINDVKIAIQNQANNEIKLDNYPSIDTSESKASEHDSEKSKKVVNPNIYSFDSFITCHSNEFAKNTARAVAEAPGVQYNPYFIWGASGLGKTHLLKAIERFDKKAFPTKKVVYTTAEDFLNDFTKSMFQKTQEQFRIKYREVDVLLIDDIQFLSDKPALQQELFNTFNKLYQEQKQMVFSCDQPIERVKSMEARLVGRFKSGLTVSLQSPEFELRLAILQNWVEAYSLKVNSDSLEYIATNFPVNVRELKGIFTNVLSKASIYKVDKITKDHVMSWLKDEVKIKINTSPISVEKVMSLVAKYFNITISDLEGDCRNKSIAYARHVAMYLSRKVTTLSTNQIASHFGNREHATVLHAVDRIQTLLEKSDEQTLIDVECLTRELQQ